MEHDCFLFQCYLKYVSDWCRTRGYDMADLHDENGINGECCACLDEFETNEYQDEAYMTTILTKRELKVWKRFRKERRKQ